MGNKLIKPQCFSHKLPKGMYPKFRLLPENIDLVADMEMHKQNAKRYEPLEVRRDLEIELSKILEMRSGS